MRRSLAAIAVGLALLTAGCGSGSANGAPAQKTTSKKQPSALSKQKKTQQGPSSGQSVQTTQSTTPASPSQPATPKNAVTVNMPAQGLGFAPSQILFTSAQDGWALQLPLAQAAGNAVIYGTTDGGATWAQQLSAPDATTAQVSLVPVGAAGVALVGLQNVLYTDLGGGATWQSLATPGDSGAANTSLSAAGAWFTVSGVIGAAGTEQGQLFESTDQGQTWHEVSTVSPPGDLTGISFSSPLDGFMGVLPAIMGFTVLYQTTDGGLTWSRASSPAATHGLSQSQIATDAPLMLGSSLLMPLVAQAAPPVTYLSSSADGGTTWSAPEKVPGAISDFLSTSQGWSAQGSQLWTTADGGQTWSPYTLPTGDALLALDFISAQTGWAVVTGGASGELAVLQTTDGGLKWSAP